MYSGSLKFGKAQRATQISELNQIKETKVLQRGYS